MTKMYEAELWHYGVKGMKWRKHLHSRDRHDNGNSGYAERGEKIGGDESIGMLTGRPNIHSRKRNDSGKSAYAERKRRFGTSPYDVGILTSRPKFHSRKRNDKGKSGYAFRRNSGKKKSGTPVFTKIRYATK